MGRSGRGRKFTCVFGVLGSCWTCDYFYSGTEACICKQMPKECRRAPDGKPSPNNPDSCKDWNHCIHLRASSLAGIASDVSDGAATFSNEAYFEDLKKCIFHDGNWSMNGCSIDTKNFPPVNDADVDVHTVLEHIDTATLEVMRDIMQGQPGGLVRRHTLDDHRSVSVSVPYCVMAVGFLALLVWLLKREHNHHCNEKNHGKIEVTAATPDMLDSLQKNGICVSGTTSSN